MKSIDDAAKKRVDAARLVLREHVRDAEGDEIGDRVVDAMQSVLQSERGGRDERLRGRIGTEDPERALEELAAIGLVGDQEDFNERDGFARAEVMPLDRVEERVLVIGAHGRQSEGEGRSDGARSEPLVQSFGAARGDL